MNSSRVNVELDAVRETGDACGLAMGDAEPAGTGDASEVEVSIARVGIGASVTVA